jgi:nucleoside-diphosphate-sugar epimerase
VESGARPVPVIRDPARWAAAGIALVPRIARLDDAAALRAALRDATHVVSTAHARYAAAVIAAAPPNARFVFIGSTRKFTRWLDDHGNGVIAGEAAFLASDRAGVMLHPTMIYGAQGEDNVQRLARVLRRVPVLPLPNGGAALVQPIHQDDITRAVLAALGRDWDGPHPIVIAGPRPIRYADFVGAVAAAAGLRPPRIVPCPAAPLIMLASVTRLLPFLPTVRTAEIRRLLEDKAFDIRPMRAMLGVEPMPLEAGLARTFARSHKS